MGVKKRRLPEDENERDVFFFFLGKWHPKPQLECPYWRLDPIEHRSCCTLKLSKISHVKKATPCQKTHHQVPLPPLFDSFQQWDRISGRI
jgi:hypothetical protein